MNKDIFKQFPIIQVNSEITLRELKHTDALAFKNILSHEKVSPYIPNDVIPSSIGHSLREINFLKGLFTNQQSVYWGIEHKTEGLIGTAGFESWLAFHNRLELAFELHPDYWGQGIMSSSLKCIIDYAFEIMQVNRIDAYTLVDNQRSHKILKKIGFIHEGTLHKYRMFNGQFVDIFIFGITTKNA
jgi:ribosomal-protein-alanine N-acetyltransferase